MIESDIEFLFCMIWGWMSSHRIHQLTTSAKILYYNLQLRLLKQTSRLETSNKFAPWQICTKWFGTTANSFNDADLFL